jgi:hypothetical protein
MVPVGYYVGARRIRNAFLQSQRNRQTATLHEENNMPPQRQNLINTWAVRSLLWVILFN